MLAGLDCKLEGWGSCISVSGWFLPGLTPNVHRRSCDPVIRQTKLYDSPSSPTIRNYPNL